MATNNEKLTELLKGRTINGTAQSSGETIIHFGDGSKLTVETVTNSSSNSASTGGAISAVTQTEDPDTLRLETDGGGGLTIPMAGPDSKIQLENESGATEYGSA